MLWFWVVVIVVLIGGLTVLFVGSDDPLADVYDERPDKTVQVGGPLTADDVRDVSFTTAVRGYRMDEVDAFLARVEADLLAREARAVSASAQSSFDERALGGSSGDTRVVAGSSDDDAPGLPGSADGAVLDEPSGDVA